MIHMKGVAYKICIAVLTFALVVILICLYLSSDFLFTFALSRRSGEKVYSKSVSPVKQANATLQQEFHDNLSWFNSQKPIALKIKSNDGLNLVGYFLPSSQKSTKLCILAHGYGSEADNMSPYAEFYHNEGFNVFVPDDRAHGKSEGQYIGMGWLDRNDYKRWINLLIGRIGPNTQIVLHGVSMGGATVMMLSGEQLPSNVKCIIEDCGYTSVHDEFQYQFKKVFNLPPFPLLNLTSFQSKIHAGYSFEEASALNEVRKSRLPIFFIHGSADTYVPTTMVYTLYNADKGVKKLWVVPEAKHAESYFTDKKGYQTQIREFYSRYLT